MAVKTILVTVSDDRQGRKGGVYGYTQDSITDTIHYFFDDDILHKNWSIASLIPTKNIINHVDAGINGRAYKPMVIKIELEQLNDGDFLIYNDCSPEIWNTSWNNEKGFNVSVIHSLCERNHDILTAFVKWDYQNIPAKSLGMHIHKYFTTDLCMDTMGLRAYENSYQHASGMMCIRKTPETVKFVEEWLYWNLNPKCASLGDPESGTDGYWQAESDRKIGHRHDQSISGLLLNARNADLVDILHNDMNPYNFLQFCRVGQEYNFINSNTPIEPRMDMNKVFIRVGSHVRNEADVLLRVFGVDGDNIKVGQFEESCWIEDRSKLKLV
jgi:hypothetical protein